VVADVNDVVMDRRTTVTAWCRSRQTTRPKWDQNPTRNASVKRGLAHIRRLAAAYM
jgi:hypothetical protein